MNTAATHIENANFLRELAESLPRIHPKTNKPEQVALLQRLADDELEHARYDQWVRAKVAAARADTRPKLTTQAVRASLKSRSDRLRNAL